MKYVYQLAYLSEKIPSLRVFVFLTLFSFAGFVAKAQINSFPHTENWESQSTCGTGTGCTTTCPLTNGWTNETIDNTDWRVDIGGTVSSGTGPGSTSSGGTDQNPGTSTGNYLFIESSSCLNSTADLISPAIDLTGIANLSMDLWYHMLGATMGTMQVDVSTDGGLTWTNIEAPFTDDVDLWQMKTIVLDAYAGLTINIRIRGITGTSFTSDMAIDEITFYELSNNDAGVASIDAPTSPGVPGLNNIDVTIANYGLANLTSATINWSVDGAIQTAFNWTGSIAPGASLSNVNIGTYTFADGVYDIAAWTSAPNGGTDGEHSNDSAFALGVIFCPPLNGFYTIDQNSLISPTNYTSIQDIVDEMVQCGISGAVTIDVIAGSGPYNEQVIIPEIPGVSSTSTINFNGNGETIAFASENTNQRAVIKLDGADYITINDFIIDSDGGTYGFGIHLINQANFNSITNNTINGNTTSTSANYCGIAISSSHTSFSGLGDNANNTLISGNTIIGGQYGISNRGQSGNMSVNNQIINNIIRDTYTYNIYNQHQSGLIIRGNDFSRPNRTESGNFYGVHLVSGVSNVLIENNRFHNTHDVATDQSDIAYGIWVNVGAAPGEETQIINNLFYNFSSSSGNVYPIYVSNDHVRVYHNSISLDNTSASGGITRGISINGSYSNVDVKNNIISLTRTSLGAQHGIYLASNTISADFNIVYAPNANYGFLGGDQPTLVDWQSAGSLFNIGSHDLDINPIYTDPVNGDLLPTNTAVNNSGTGVGVAFDILGNPRDPGSPDPGAYEFTPAGLDANITWVAPFNPVSTGNNSIIVNINNAQTAIINSVSLSYTDGANTITESFTGLNLTSGSNVDLTFSTQYNVFESVFLYAYINSVNGVTDDDSSNDTTITVFICPALSGNYTIDQTQLTAGTNFANFSDAIAAMLTCGIGGPVTIDVTSGTGPYNEQVIISELLGASSINTVTFNGNGNEIIYASTTSAERAIIKLLGADYITINDFIITDGGGTYAYGVQLINDADHNTISNCVININSISTSTINFGGIIINSSATSLTATGSSLCDNNIITGNTINGGQTGIGIVANGSTSEVLNNSLTNNIIQDFRQYGIYLNGNNNTLVEGNDISRPTRTSLTEFRGIYLTSNNRNCKISKNILHNPFDGNLGQNSSCYAINLNSTNASSGEENIISNNLIYNMFSNASSGNLNGLLINNSTWAKIYHNSINLDDVNADVSTGGTRGIYVQSPSATNGLDIKNNIISVSRGGNGPKQIIYFEGTGITLSSDHNNYIITSTTGTVEFGVANGSNYTDLASWRTGTGQDLNSVSADPIFTNPALGNLKPNGGIMNDIGIDLTAIVPDDIDGVLRPSTPDPGAYEYTPPSLDAGITWVSPLPGGLTPGPQSITVQIINNQADVITSLELGYTDGTTSVSEIVSGLNLAQLDILNYTFSAPYNLNGFVEMKAYITLVNNVADGNQGNDTTYQTLCPGLTGNFTIDQNSSASSTNFESFQPAIDAMLSCGISGPVTFDVVAGSGPYNVQVVIPEILGAGSVNTVTFNGNGETIQFASTTSAERSVIRLDGADYITINDFVINPDGGTYGWGIHLINQANFNNITNNIINGNTTSTSSTNFGGIVISGSYTSMGTTGDNANNTTISGNTIIGGYYGIVNRGVSGNLSVNNQIINNTIQDAYTYVIFNQYQDGLIIRGNDISRPNRSSVTTFYGIYVVNDASNCLIEENRIHNTHGNNSSTAATYGIYINGAAPAGFETHVVNNLVYNMNSPTSTIYGLWLNDNGIRAYHNTISLDNSAATSGITRGIATTTSSYSNIEVFNNVISITRGGSGTKHGIWTSTISYTSNNNVVYVDAPDGTNYFGRWGTTDYLTLGDWQTGSGQGISSLDLNPMFTDPLNVDFTPANSTVNNSGTGVGVGFDILGNPRDPVSPDPGAYEFTPVGLDANITWVAPLNPVTAGPNTVVVNINNAQTATINSVSITYTDGIISETELFNSLALTAGNSIDLTFATPYNLSGTANLFAYINAVNGVTDDDQSNDTTVTITICPAISGIFTIDSSLPTGSSNFNSFSDAVNQLVACGISGPVVFNVVAGSGPYNEQVVIPEIIGNDVTNTITFNGNNERIAFSSIDTDNRAVIRLQGVDYVTIDNLIIDASGPGFYGWGIHLMNAADNITISNCTVITDEQSTNTVNYAGIVASGSLTSPATAGDNTNNTMIINNTVIGGYYGIRINGTSASLKANGNQIIGNKIKKSRDTGIFMIYQNAPMVSDNFIDMRLGNTGSYGMELSNLDNDFQVLRNTVINPGIRGIYVTTGNAAQTVRATIANNMVGGGFQSTGTTYGIYLVTVKDINVWHNSVNLDNGSGRGLYLSSSTTTNADIRNNSFAYTGGGAGYAMYISSTASVLASDYNNYFSNGSNFVYYGGAKADLSALQATNTPAGNDLNSHEGDPYYTTAIDLHSVGTQLNNKATPISGIPDDINGETRNLTNPDIGADEYTPLALDVALSAFIAPAAYSCHTTMEDVQIEIISYGVDTIDFSITPATIIVSTTGVSSQNLNYILNTGKLGLLQTMTVSIGTLNLVTPGTHVLSANLSLAGDGDLTNNDLSGYEINSVGPSPEITGTTGDTRCGIGLVDLSATSTAGSTIAWYDEPSGGTQLFVGNSYSPFITSSTNFYASALKSISDSVSTGFGGGTTINADVAGSMFDVRAKNDLVVTGFDVHLQNVSGTPSEISVYYKAGSFQGTQTTASAWTLLGSVSGVVSQGPGNPTPLPLPISVSIPGGEIYGFYIVVENAGSANRMLYSSAAQSPPIGDVAAEDDYLQVLSGTTIGGPFTTVIASSEFNRMWNGNIYYEVNCESPRIGVLAESTPAPIVEITGSSVVCGNESVDLNISSGASDYTTFDWSPSTGLNTTTGTSVTASPDLNTTYVVFASGNINGCQTADTFDLEVVAPPELTVSAPGGTFFCDVASTQLIADAGSGGGSVGAPNEGGGGSYTLEAGLIFDAHTDFTIEGVHIYPIGTGPGTVEIVLRDPSNTIIQNYIFNGTGTSAPGIKTYVPINFNIPTQGTGYSISMLTKSGGITALARDGSAAITGGGFPFILPDVVTITSGRCCPSAVSASYYYFYDWQIAGSAVSYQWSPGTGLSDPTISDPIATPTTTTTYVVVVTDTVTGCTSSDSVTIVVGETPTPVITSSESMPLCEGESTTLSTQYTAVNGYTFSWNGGLFTSESITVNLPGTYDCVVTSSEGCTSTLVTFDVEVSTIFADILEIIDASCFDGSDGSVEIEVLGALLEPDFTIYFGPFDYSMNGGALQSSPLFTGLSAGTYTFTVHDPTTGCVLNLPATVGEAPEIVPGPAVINQNVSCNGLSDGSATVSATGGTGVLTYIWNTPVPKQGELNDEIPAGTWTVTITDENGCTATMEVTITEPQALATSFNVTDATFWNAENGAIEAIVSGGTPTYDYLWSTLATTSTIGGLSAGTYTLTITDDNGCVLVESAVVNEPPFECTDGKNITHTIQGPGGWGGQPSGNNPATYLYANFAAGFPNGLTIGHPAGTPGGCNRSITLTSEQAVTDFLPSAGQPRRLDPGHQVNITASQYGNIFASMTVALTLGVVFDTLDPNYSPLTTVAFGEMVYLGGGTYNGMTVYQILDAANEMLACGGRKNELSQINTVIDNILHQPSVLGCPASPVVRNITPELNTLVDDISINIYPNPTSGIVNISFESVEVKPTSIMIMDLQGRIVMKINDEMSNSFLKEINLSNFDNGLYIINFMNENGIIKSARISKVE